MHKTVFSRELRLLLCPRCGAPIEGALAGGLVSCRYCGASAMLPPRDESRETTSAATPPIMGEAERFRLLREQGHRPWLVPPPSLQHLCVDGRLPHPLVAEAFAEFQRARAEAAAGGSFGAEERVLFLAYLLYEHLRAAKKDAEVRALLETARDVLSDPLHRQTIHGMLARNAARAGDPAAAEGWLGLLTQHATDLQMDTAYRLSRAYLSTHAGDFGAVLRVLGTRLDDVPLAESFDPICAVLRANALERTGHGEIAVQQLAQVAARQASGAAGLAQIAAVNSELALCPRSLPVVLGRSTR